MSSAHKNELAIYGESNVNVDNDGKLFRNRTHLQSRLSVTTRRREVLCRSIRQPKLLDSAMNRLRILRKSVEVRKILMKIKI